MSAALMTWYNMIESQLMALLTAILAGVTVPVEDLQSSEFGLRSRSFDQIGQADNRGYIVEGISRVNIPAPVLQHLCLAAKDKGKRSPGMADI
jgi:hypothetical protein